MPTSEKNDLPLPFAAPDVATEVARWRAFLAAERRMSGKTVEAYSRDVSQFLAFQAEHLGGKVSLARLIRIKPSDVRAFMASRRADGMSLARNARTAAAHDERATLAESTAGIPVTPICAKKTNSISISK